MKTIVKKLILAVLILSPVCGFAQHTFTQATDMDVSGIFIGGKYRKVQVVAKWGNPTSYRSNTSEFGTNETYHYSDNLFRFSDNGYFNSFYINTPNFVVCTSLDGGLKVGDHISRIYEIGLGRPVRQGDGTYRIPSGDDRFIVGHSDGKITWISFVSPI